MKPTDPVAAWYAAVPREAKRHVATLRALVKRVAPKATEKLAYGVPTFVLGKNLVHLGAYATHVALYGGRAMALEGPLAKYQSGKGTLRFELDEPLPLKALTQLVRARVAENLAKARGPGGGRKDSRRARRRSAVRRA
ncbi:MAG: DUF1801 domain-containing protein [Myxococcaceae bacterium]|nr:DUF1801 domain-containing protein [Myxococcaceae bacterium]